MERESPIKFQAFNERAEVRIYYHGSLPHWRQDGCTYFVTFRTADSLPQSVLNEIKEQRNQWLRAHHIDSTSANWRDEFAKLPEEQRRDYERKMATNLNRELDCSYGSCVLRRLDLAQIVADSLTFHDKKRVHTGDYVIMPNHVHALMTPMIPNRLEDVLKSIKSFTAGKINGITGSSGTFWQRDSYDHIVRDSEQLGRFQEYIHENPSNAGLDEEACLQSKATYDTQ